MPDRSPVGAAAIFALLILGLLLPGRAAASLDSLELQLRQQYPPALRWDNIEGSPFLVDGPPLFMIMLQACTCSPLLPVRISRFGFL